MHPRLPDGISKLNKIKRKLLPFISPNWRSHRRRDGDSIVVLIAPNETKARLKMQCTLEETL